MLGGYLYLYLYRFLSLFLHLICAHVFIEHQALPTILGAGLTLYMPYMLTQSTAL
jgi:hypothetical protein